MVPFMMQDNLNERLITDEEAEIVSGGQCARRCGTQTDVGPREPLEAQIGDGDSQFDGMMCEEYYA